MGLKDHKYKNTYRSFSDNIVSDFLEPTLKQSSSYWRGTGFFTLSGLATFLDSILTIIKKNGEVRIITSPLLKEKDIELLSQGELLSEDEMMNLIKSEIKFIETEELRMTIISKLISQDLIQLKIAYLPTGIYHEKIGILNDGTDTIVFIGSFNETKQAQVGNYETIEILTSWDNENTVTEHIRYFENIWNNENQHLNVISFPDALKKQIIDTYSSTEDLDNLLIKYEQSKIKEGRKLYKYQEEAIRQFKENQFLKQ